MQIIGISGRAGAGKDTVADYLVDKYGFTRISFADPIRAGLKAMLGLTDAHFNDRLLKEAAVEPYGVSPRYMMQTLGTEWGRDLINPHLWLLTAKETIARARENGARGVVFSDIRFNNEATWVRNQHGILVSVLRPNQATVESHCSETSLSVSPDYTLINDRGIADLCRVVDSLLSTTAADVGG